MTMNIEMKKDRSVYYWLKTLFADVPIVNIEDSFPAQNLTLPTISVDLDSIATYDPELGNRTKNKITSWYIDVFAENKAQRDGYAFRILDALNNKIDVYDYDMGFPPSSSPSKIGCLDPQDVNLSILKIFPDLTEKMYYRATVSFSAEYSQT